MGGDKKEILEKLSKELAGIADEGVREALLAVLNVIEQDAETIRQFRLSRNYLCETSDLTR